MLKNNELIMVRHGQSEYNARMTSSLDSALSDLGIEQIYKTGRALATLPQIKDFVGHASPYLRTLQTAAILKGETGVNFKVVLGPRECMTIYDHCKIDDYREYFPDFDWEDIPVGGLEVFREDDDTYLARIQDYVNSVRDKKILTVSHGVPVVTMMELLMGVRRTPSMYYYVSNGSITHLHDERLVRFNHV